MATWLAEFLDKLGTWSNQAWASLEPIMPNVAKIPKDFLEATHYKKLNLLNDKKKQ